MTSIPFCPLTNQIWGSGPNDMYLLGSATWILHYPGRWLGDIDGDGHVDVTDLLAMVGTWGLVRGDAGFKPECDLDNNGGVDVGDLLILVQNWGR